MTPAMWAAAKVHAADPLRLLVTLGADLGAVDSLYGNTALHWALAKGNHSAAAALLRLGADVGATNRQVRRLNMDEDEWRWM